MRWNRSDAIPLHRIDSHAFVHLGIASVKKKKKVVDRRKKKTKRPFFHLGVTPLYYLDAREKIRLSLSITWTSHSSLDSRYPSAFLFLSASSSVPSFSFSSSFCLSLICTFFHEKLSVEEHPCCYFPIDKRQARYEEEKKKRNRHPLLFLPWIKTTEEEEELRT